MSNKQAQLENLSQSILLEEAQDGAPARKTIYVIAGAVGLFLAWAAVTQVGEIAQAAGDIIPSGRVQIIQHLEGGIVSDIFVRDGELVEAGQVLVKLQGSGAGEDLQSLTARQLSLRLQAERLDAFANGRASAFDKTEGADAAALDDQKAKLDAMIAARKGESDVLTEQIGQKERALGSLKERGASLSKDIGTAREMLNMEQKASSTGAGSRKSVLSAQKELNGLQGQAAQVGQDALRAEQEISEYKNRKSSLEAKYRNDALQQLDAVQRDIASNKEQIAKLNGRVDRQDVKSPVRGLVKGLRINTVGGVLAPGAELMQIVPLDEKLVVEARISPRDVGHVRIGQKVHVKVSAFDFSRYGAIDGKLQSVSATTFTTDKGEAFYRGEVALDRNYVGPDPKNNLIVPGMTVEADIVTGQKSILAYMLKPVQVSLGTAFTER